MAFLSEKFRILRYILPLILALVFFSLTGRTQKRVPWYESMVWNVIEPPQHLFMSISSGISGAWNRYLSLIGVEKENHGLKHRLAELEGWRIRMEEVEQENQRLKELLKYHDSFPDKTVVARVVANDARSEFKSVTVNRGSRDGLKPLMPVIGPKGLVGKVGRVAGSFSEVILITDPNSAVDAFVQRSRVRGMLVGAAWTTDLKAGYYLTRLEYLKGESDLSENDVVVTSGLDGVFPPGIPIGTLKDIRMSPYGVFRDANVVPFENMAELQEVMVLLKDVDIAK